MEIEIVTTRKKLSKSILVQMPEAKTEHMANCTVLGYIVGVHPDCYKVILIKTVDNVYYLVKVGYHTDIKEEMPGGYDTYRRQGNWSYTKKFKDFAAYSEWRLTYMRVCQVANNSQQIYI